MWGIGCEGCGVRDVVWGIGCEGWGVRDEGGKKKDEVHMMMDANSRKKHKNGDGVGDEQDERWVWWWEKITGSLVPVFVAGIIQFLPF